MQRVSFLVGTWLSLVEHSLGVRGVGSSNLPVPTIPFLFFAADFRCCLPARTKKSTLTRKIIPRQSLKDPSPLSLKFFSKCS